ncbi:MAG: TonB family protein [Prochloraceae cyanobacterium]
MERKVWRRPDPFLLFLLLSVLLHGVALFVLAFWNRLIPPTPQKKKYAPVEFVVVPPQESPNPETKRRALTNSVAKGAVKPKIPPATDKLPGEASSANQKPQPVVAPKVSVAPKAKSPVKRQSTPQRNQTPRTQTKPLKPLPTLTKRGNSSQPVKPLPTARKQPVAKVAPSPTPMQKPSSSSSPASLLGGSYARGNGDNSASSFFNPQASASRQDPNQRGVNARKDADLGPYLNELWRRVKRNWKPTTPQKDRYTVVVFSIHRDGNISGLKLVETSGSPVADQEAMEAIRKSAPFAPLPKDYAHDRFKLTFSFNIYVKRGTFNTNMQRGRYGF